MHKKELLKRAKNIKAVVLDADGVFFTGRVLIDPVRGEALKERSHIDGQGISFLRVVGLSIAIISGEKTGFVEVVAEKLNSLPSVKAGEWEKIKIFTGFQGEGKVRIIDEWLKDIGVAWFECAFMGDDLPDFAILKKVGLAAAPAQAEEIVKKIAHYIAPREGGNGAIRDLSNLILEAKKIDITTLCLR